LSTELAWAAGFFDGEGHTGYVRSRSAGGSGGGGGVQMTVPQTETTTLVRFHAAVRGLGRVSERSQHYRDHPNWSSRWDWRCWRKDDVHAVFDMLDPYLSRPKRAQVFRAFALYDMGRSFWPRGHHPHTGQYRKEKIDGAQ
jgi:hypothetical protein